MIKSVRLGNLKSFARPQVANLAPITLIFGPNSSGKSTLLQGMLLLLQSLGEGRPDTGLVTKGRFVDLGSFVSLVTNHDQRQRISLGLSVESGTGRARSTDIDLNFRWNASRAGVDVANVALSGTDLPSLTFAWRPPVESEAVSGRRGHYSLATEEDRSRFAEWLAAHSQMDSEDLRFALDGLRSGVARPLFAPRGMVPGLALEATVPAGAEAERRYAALGPRLTGGVDTRLRQVSMDIGRVVARSRYIGPYRRMPERFETVGEGARGLGVGTAGENIASVLGRSDVLQSELDTWLTRLGVPYALNYTSFVPPGAEALGRVGAILLTDRRSGVVVTPRDVGFGVSQVLPIVAEILGNRGSIIFIEQPELHLHPRLQSEMADLLIEGSLRRRNQLVIETHSEHLVLRLQRRIREGTLAASHVQILYVDHAPGGATVEALRLDDDGEFIDEWPEGFFEERYHEIFGEL